MNFILNIVDISTSASASTTSASAWETLPILTRDCIFQYKSNDDGNKDVKKIVTCVFVVSKVI